MLSHPLMRWTPSLILLVMTTLGGSAYAPVPAASGVDDQGALATAVTPAGAASTISSVRFVPNLGQWSPEVRYAALGDTTGWLHDDGFTLRYERWAPRAAPATIGVMPEGPRQASGCVVRTRFLGSDEPALSPGPELGPLHNFFLGNDPQRWRSGVPGHQHVRLCGVWPGIDVVFRPLPGGRRGPFEYDLVLAPGADLARFAAVCEGVDTLRIDDEGRLCARIATPDGETELLQEAPIAWQDTEAGAVPCRVAFRLLGPRTYGFVSADLDPRWSATVDPGIIWGTFLGGGASDSISDMQWRPGSGVWVAGWAGSTDFPTTPGAYRTTGGSDAFAARMNDSGTALIFATYLGGSEGEEIRGIALGPADTIAVGGFTGSTNFPVTPGALQPTFGGTGPFVAIGDAFVARLSAAGNALLGATYLGGSSEDGVEGVAVDALGNTVVTGFSFSPNFPTTPGCWQPFQAGIPLADSDGFVARVSADAQSLGYSTLVGGNGSDQLLEVEVDPTTGGAVVGGWAISSNYPTTPNAYRTTSAGDIEAVITKLNPNGTGPVFSTYLGGIVSEAVHAVRVAPDGSVWIGGRTNSPNFPATLDAPQLSLAGYYDGFISQLSGNGQNLLFSTLLGGPNVDSVGAIDLHGADLVAVGETGAGFPVTTDALQLQFAGGNLDAFVTYLKQAGRAIGYSTYLGGVDQDTLAAVAIDDSGVAVVAGWSFSSDFPIGPPGLQSQRLGIEDGVVLKIDLLSDLGPGVSVAAMASPPAQQFVGPGEHEVLAANIQNHTTRQIRIDSVRLLAAGEGSAPAHAGSLRVYMGAVGQPGALVAGPMSIDIDNAEMHVPLTGALLPPSGTAELRVRCDLSADPLGSTVEMACAIVDADAWSLTAIGAGPGPSVRVMGTGRVDGPILVLGEVPGDADGDHERTVADVRRLLAQLGVTDRAIDCDGDQTITQDDVTITRNAMLGRPTLLENPAAVQKGAWFTLHGAFPRRGPLEASLGGRALTPGRVTQREITLRVDATQTTGTQDLVVMLDGRTVFAGPVLVQ